MIGQTTSHYRILEELGRGGMGVVWKAHDEKLDRDVALKVLKPELLADEEHRQRFLREALSAAAVTHPYIASVYDAGEADRTLFIAMEYVEGKTLRALLAKGPLPIPEVQQYATEIAEGLAKAHQSGLVHRDIKPDNVMIASDGHAKILDFGLAKVVEKRDEAATVTLGKAEPPDVTTQGAILGTPAYMSPEQARGERVDSRSDIFSFGSTVYEMVTGKAPFSGPTHQDTLASILRDEPLSPHDSNPAVSGELNRIISRCLHKRPEDRYNDTRDLVAALRSLQQQSGRLIEPIPAAKGPMKAHSPAGYIASALVIAIAGLASYLMLFRPGENGTHALNPNRVFVAAFENRTGVPSLDPIGRLMSDWVTQGIIDNELAEVIPTTAMLPMIQGAGLVGGGLADRAKLIELAEATKSRILISGMFYDLGEDIQFEAQIIDVQENDVLVMLERVRGARGEPMKAINELRQKIMGALVIHAFPLADIRMVGEPPIYEAYVEYLEGTRIFGLDYERAFDHYRRAIEIDQQFMGPKFRMATGYANMGQWTKADSIFQSIDRHTRRLSAYERNYLDWFGFRLQGRHEEEFAVLLHIESIAPMDFVTNYLVGLHALWINRPRTTVETFSKLDFQIQWADFAAASWRFEVLSMAYHLLGNHQKEMEVAREGQTHFPSDLGLRNDQVSALAALGNIEELYRAVEASKHIEQPRGSVGVVMCTACLELRAHGNRTEALRIADQAIQWYEEHDSGNRAAYAEALYCAERWDESFAVYTKLAAENPEDVGLKGALGALAARRGDQEEARRISRELERTDQKYLFGRHTYNRACIHALLGEHAVAVKLIERAFEQGCPFDIHIHRDMDLEALRDYPPFQELLKPKG